MFPEPSIFAIAFGLLIIPTCMTYLCANVIMPRALSLYRCGMATIIECIVVLCFLSLMAIFGLENILIESPNMQFLGYSLFGMIVFRWILHMRWSEALVINLLSTLTASLVFHYLT